ncbi:TPA: hypothetical protein ACNFRY_001390 [Pseudomonas aeruginosa]|uniref:hypothetical protein n=1 Tax=Pseudomonas aeruginosa TaxID=287 RepID=UPI00044F6A49|nr:hypothetical protein [Pseudomonas aeruginosa]EZP24583.1 hypothetical protein V550_00391 [Pseudomonas aeruginosa BWH049]KSD06008.1 hypothetical protein AO899_11665 [Pseudomonas aeruginosa]MBX5528578.1 hypothetical protein [Pseudomonas aeruginosa]MBX5558729.1 hypothetical protein [Pseudomonas aeruginosa]MBX5635691.1 hypothetical protein [Pseudomonas aeruginosa]
MQLLSVRDCESFLDALERIESGLEDVSIAFDGWPNFDVKISGERYNSTMTSKLMQGFISYQEEVLRSYAEIKYGTSSLLRLTNEEKASLEIVFHIAQGSTEGEGSLDGIANRLLDKIPFHKMTPRQVALCLALTIGSVAGYFVFSEWQDTVRDQQRLEAQTATASHYERLFNRFSEALASPETPQEARRVHEHTQEGYKAIFAGAPDATSASIQGKGFTQEQMHEITSRESPSRQRVERHDSVIIESIKRTPEYLTLTMRLPHEETTFTGRIDLMSFTPEALPQVFDAFRDSTPIRFFHFATVEAGGIVKTQVLAVDSIEQQVAPVIARDLLPPLGE